MVRAGGFISVYNSSRSCRSDALLRRVGPDAEAALQAKAFGKFPERSEGARSALNLGGTADGIIRPELSSREFGAF